MVARALRLVLIGTCLAISPGCGETKAPEPPVAPNIPGAESAASRRYMKPEYMQGFDKNGKLILKPGMKPPTPQAAAGPKP